MKFFFPDSQDFVDESFDFVDETRSEDRVRQRDDSYPHEIFSNSPYNGILVSKAVVDGLGGGTGKYSGAQRHRFLRVGVREYFRLDPKLESMGDCGAFTYVREQTPPYTAQEVANFYAECGFDYGFSVDHVILGYKPECDRSLIDLVPPDWRARQEITFELAAEFLSYCQSRALRFTPIGVAQGWSPASYADAVQKLQKIGYTYIAFGGFVPLKTRDILDCLEAASKVRQSSTRFHLLGISRCENVQAFEDFGVVSFDSTAPLRRAFKDDKHNYYTPAGTYTALRVPQVDANPELVRRIRAGQVRQESAREAELKCLNLLSRYDRDEVSLEETLEALREYEKIFDGETDRRESYRRTLEDRPWKDCSCEVCTRIGIHAIIFRGAERNRRRGFHNLYAFNRQLQARLEQRLQCVS